MTDIHQALDPDLIGFTLDGKAYMPKDAFDLVHAAARAHADWLESFPTDEDVEVAALNMHFADEGARSAGYYRELARAALQAIAESRSSRATGPTTRRTEEEG